MESVAKFPYITTRNGSKNLYYKRPVAPEFREAARRHAEALAEAAGRPLPKGGTAQIWRSLGTPDRKQAELKYATVHMEVEDLFEDWRRELQGLPVATPEIVEPDAVALTGPLTRRILDRWKADLFEADFRQRGELWAKANADHDAFWRGEVFELPRMDPYFAHLDEDGERPLHHSFLYVLNLRRKERLEEVRTLHKLGDCKGHRAALAGVLEKQGVKLSDTDMLTLSSRVMIAEIETLEKLVKSDAVDAPLVEEPPAPVPQAAAQVPQKPGMLMKDAIREYIREALRERGWRQKDEMRFKGHLDEFLEIAGNKPVNTYTRLDGATYKSVQLRLPKLRHTNVFKGKSLLDCAKIADRAGTKCERLSPLTVKDKVGTVERFFEWACASHEGMQNPMEHVTVAYSKKKARKKKRVPWSIDELNRMFAAPIFTGAKSGLRWKEPGDVVLNTTAMYWAPLLGLFTGMRLGEIIQLRVTDIKEHDGVHYIDAAFGIDDEEEGEEAKAFKSATSVRGVPVHQALIDQGLLDFVERQRRRGETRLFPDYQKSKDDGSWSKAFGKHFARFREAINIGDGRDFHSLRGNMEDGLRNAGVLPDVRLAVQGRTEGGSAAHYGLGHYLATLNAAVQKVRYPGLLLPHRHPIMSDLAETN